QALGNNLVTLRDAINTGNNGGGIGHGNSIEPVQFIDTANKGQPLSGTIGLQQTLPSIQKSYNIGGPGASTLAVSGNNSYRLFTVGGGVTSSISGLTIEYGNAAYGGGVFNSERVNESQGEVPAAVLRIAMAIQKRAWLKTG